MRKHRTSLHPQPAYRIPRGAPQDLKKVLDIVNGQVFMPERYEPEKSDVRSILDQIIAYCDRIEDLLESNAPRKERIRKIQQLAWRGLVNIFEPNYPQWDSRWGPSEKREFKISIWVQPAERQWKRGVLPPASDLFRVTDLFMWPSGNVKVHFYWEFYQGIIQLQDLRRLRRCSGYLHDGPFYFLRKKTDRMENYFCSDQCRSDFNYKKFVQEKSDGRQRSKKG
jgi:hypothetical protein